MIKKLLAGILETLHLASLSILFTMTAWVSPIAGPAREWKGSGLAATHASSVAGDFQNYLRDHGPWLAAVSMVTVALASFLRGDMKRLLAGARLAMAGAILLFSLWAFMGLPKDRYATAWNCLFLVTCGDVLCTAFLIGGKGGGSSGKGASGGSEKSAK